jgi:hypothetical protein
MGGLGIEPMSAMTVASGAWRAPKADSLTLLDQSGWRKTLIAEEFKEWSVTAEEVDQLSQNRVREKIMADDVPNVRGSVFKDTGPPRDGWVRTIHIAMPGVTLNELFRVYMMCRSLVPQDLKEGVLPNLKPGADYGAYRYLLPTLREVSEISRVRKEQRLMAWLKSHDIAAWGAVYALEDRGLSRTEAIAWLTGDMSSPITTSLHPMLTADVSRLAIFCVQSVVLHRYLKPGNLTWFFNRAFQILEEACVSSVAVRVLYTW